MAVSFIDGGNRNTGENHRPVANHRQTLVVIGTDCTGSCKSNYHKNHIHSDPFNNMGY